MKEIWIDNYSISETGPGYYLISMNGTPCMSFSNPSGLNIKQMKEHLLEYINRKTMIDVNTKAGDKDE